jgi:transcriptional regulator with XRE-family HTH domain
MLRIHRDERLLDMARKLEISSSFLSAIEKGKKSPPEGIEEKIAVLYSLSDVESEDLRSAADRARESFTVRPETEQARDATGLLQRRINSLSAEELEEIIGVLRRKTDD